MSNQFQNLPHQFLSAGVLISQNLDHHQPITLNDKAEMVLTDFKHTRPFSVSATATLDQINAKMIACGVRLLFVTESDGVLQGLVTYSDMFGEKPVLYIQQHGGTRGDILAQDIMTPIAELEALQISDVYKASVGDIVNTIKTAGRQHMLVNQVLEDGRQIISGLFSSTHIEKLLGIKIELSPRANTFADLERALTR